MSKKHQKREKLLCIPQEWRRSSMKVGETPGNGEESPTFREEPKYPAKEYVSNIIGDEYIIPTFDVLDGPELAFR